ncbi:MAG: Carboxyl-terminal protease [Parcubacteria group bacterium GW2011_GWA2_46_7]|nr:MAG: Carboxyl-terminal protease [Parcubacteria group bacterium GW2011_GWA2_46_7]
MQLRLTFHNPFKDKPTLSKIALVISAIIIFGVGIGLGISYQKSRIPGPRPYEPVMSPVGVSNTEPPAALHQETDFSIFWDTWKMVQEKYVGRSKLNYQKMVYGAIEGMLGSLDDPYTTFFDPEENEQFQEEISGKFQGIGVELALKNGIPTVIAPIENTPAYHAGIKSKDQIVAVGSTSTIGISLEQTIGMIRGPEGTMVTLSVLREGWTEPKKFEIQRAIIKILGVSLEYPAPDTAYLKIRNFYEATATDFRTKALEVMISGKKNIILDLRSNPGGYVDLAVQFSSWFLPPHSTVLQEDRGNGMFVCDDCSVGPIGGVFKDKNIIILVDGGTASASEIMAGALKDHLNAKLIGEQTFGKGSAQEVHDITSQASLKVTIAKWFTPNGTNIDGTGLKPDIEIKNDPDSSEDAQLKKAIEILSQ